MASQKGVRTLSPVRNETKTKEEKVMAANKSPSVVKVKKDSKQMTWAEVVTGKSKVQKNG